MELIGETDEHKKKPWHTIKAIMVEKRRHVVMPESPK
jgi:hypothetical protein